MVDLGAQLAELFEQLCLRGGRGLPAPAPALAVLPQIQLAAPAAGAPSVVAVAAFGALVVEIDDLALATVPCPNAARAGTLMILVRF